MTMTDTGGVTVQSNPPPAAVRKNKRGRETALDMLRSLGVVFLVVLPMWFFGQSSPGDSKAIRPVDPSSALSAFASGAHAPVPTTPSGWVANVATFDAGALRVGYVLGDHYLEFAGGSGPGFLETAAGKGSVLGTVDVGGVTWQRWESTDGHGSLVRTVGAVTLVVGGLRENVSAAELERLAATVR